MPILLFNYYYYNIMFSTSQESPFYFSLKCNYFKHFHQNSFKVFQIFLDEKNKIFCIASCYRNQLHHAKLWNKVHCHSEIKCIVWRKSIASCHRNQFHRVTEINWIVLQKSSASCFRNQVHLEQKSSVSFSLLQKSSASCYRSQLYCGTEINWIVLQKSRVSCFRNQLLRATEFKCTMLRKSSARCFRNQLNCATEIKSILNRNQLHLVSEIKCTYVLQYSTTPLQSYSHI